MTKRIHFKRKSDGALLQQSREREREGGEGGREREREGGGREGREQAS